MNFTNLIRIALKALSNNKMRGFLTMLGIIIGVASVITMLAIGEGSKDSIQGSISEMGSNLIMIQPGGDEERRGPGGVSRSAASMETLKMADYESLLNETKYLGAVTPSVNSAGQLIYGANNTSSTVYGVSPDYLKINSRTVDDGMMFTEQEISAAAKVCIIGKTVADKLFTNGEDPIGKVVRFNKIPFQIIGVLKSKGFNSMGMDQDDLVLAPFTTIQKRVLAITHLQGMNASAIDESYTQQAIAEISEILRRNHKLKASDSDDFEIMSMDEILSTMDSVMSMLTLLLGAVAGISLIVGGIGIMNIMYVSVTERTKEIGLRMSIGAKGRDILAQFLIEAIMISITGGIIGVIIGALLANLAGMLAGFTATILPWTVALAFGVCTFTGVFFGWYPAKKASQLDPIEAIRYE